MVTIKDIALKKLNRIDSSGELACLYEIKKLGKHREYQSNMPLWLKTYQFKSLLKEEREKYLSLAGESNTYDSEPIRQFLTQMFESNDKDIVFLCDLLIECCAEFYPLIPDVLKTDVLNWHFLRRDSHNILKIKCPTEEMWIYALNQNGELIKYIEEPTVKLQKIAVSSNREAIRCIKNPCDEVKKIALLEDSMKWSIDLDAINDPSLNELAVVLSGERIKSIENPSVKLEAIALMTERFLNQFSSESEEILNLFPFLRESLSSCQMLSGRYANEKMLTLLAREEENPSYIVPELYYLENEVSEDVLAYFVDEKSISYYIKSLKKLPLSVQCHFYQRTFSVGEWMYPIDVYIRSNKLVTFMEEIASKATDKQTIEEIFKPFLKQKDLTKEQQTQLIDYLNYHPYDFIRLPNHLKTPLICRLMTSKIEDLKLFSPYHLEEWLAKNRVQEVDLKLRITEDDGLPF